MTILIDFDGTCVTHEFPAIGKPIGAAPVLKELIKKGHKLILFTMRCDHDFTPEGNQPDKNYPAGTYLTDAVDWFRENDIPLHGINTNPGQEKWTSSPKAYGEIMIDDSALGCPLLYNPDYSARPYVDWSAVYNMLQARKIL